MATRVVRDGMLTSERIDALSPRAELFYRRIQQVADDHGRFFANAKLIRSAAYPLRTDTTDLADISAWLAQCETAGLVRLYEAKGTKYMEILDFGQRVQSRSKFPDPPGVTVTHGEPPYSTAIGGVVVEGVVEGVDVPRKRGKHTKAPEVTLPEWIERLEGGDALAADDPLFGWAGETGIPRDWIALAWWAFEARYAENPKRYADWRSVFRRAVKEDWLKLWRAGRDGFALTTAGEQVRREMGR